MFSKTDFFFFFLFFFYVSKLVCLQWNMFYFGFLFSGLLFWVCVFCVSELVCFSMEYVLFLFKGTQVPCGFF